MHLSNALVCITKCNSFSMPSTLEIIFLLKFFLRIHDVRSVNLFFDWSTKAVNLILAEQLQFLRIAKSFQHSCEDAIYCLWTTKLYVNLKCLW
jgi:hypothetical protein